MYKKLLLFLILIHSFCIIGHQVFDGLMNGNLAQVKMAPSTSFDTPTDGHIFQHHNAIKRYLYGAIQRGKNLFAQIHQQEAEEHKKGRYTFIHAQKWFWEWYAQLYKMLYETTQKTSCPYFYPFRFFNPQKINEQKEEDIYHAILERGRIDYWRKGKSLRPRLLFLNAPLFGNTQNSVCCSVDFWSRGWDESRPRVTSNKIIFRKFGLQKIYMKYKKDLDDLEHEHNQLTSHGNMLLLSMTKEFVQNNIYMARMCGYKQSVRIGWWSSTSDVCKFIDTLKQNPNTLSETDVIEFCLILTKHRSLQPTPDCHVYTFNDIEPKKWQEFNKKRNALFEKIKKEIIH